MIENQDLHRQMGVDPSLRTRCEEAEAEVKRLTTQLTAIIAVRNDLRRVNEKQHQEIIDLGKEVRRLREESAILREALEEVEELTRSHTGPDTRAAMIHGICCKALQRAGGED